MILSECSFMVAVAVRMHFLIGYEILSRILFISVWHDNSGKDPGWYLNRVLVRDLQTGMKFYFICNRWLAVDKDDGEVMIFYKLYRLLIACIHSFSKVFSVYSTDALLPKNPTLMRNRNHFWE